MKPSKLLSLFVLGTVLILGSCKSKTPRDLIINKWKLKDIAGGAMARLPDSVKAKMLKEATIEFKKDNTYALTGGGQSTPQNGTYMLSEDGKTLTTTPAASQRPEVNAVNELTANKLVVTDKYGTKVTCTD